MGKEIFTFLRESKYSVSLITVPFCPVALCPFQILAGVLNINYISLILAQDFILFPNLFFYCGGGSGMIYRP